MGEGKLYNIDLTATIVNGKILFGATSNGLGHKITKGMDEFTFSKKLNNMFKSDFYLLQFTLNDQTSGKNVRFRQNASDALWACQAADPANPKASCPKVAPDNPSNQLKALARLNDHCLLAVNKDENVEMLVFALNFDSVDGPVQWDPIGNNQNGRK